MWLSTCCNWEFGGWGVDFELSRVKLFFVIRIWVVLVSWVCVHFRSFQTMKCKQACQPTQFNLASYNLQVHDHHQKKNSSFFSWALLTSFYLYSNFCCIVISSGCWIILTWCLVPIWNFSVNVFKRTSCREVPHLLIKTDSYFAVWSSNLDCMLLFDGACFVCICTW